MGDLPLVRYYREKCLAFGPDDPMALYGLARVLCQLGEMQLAKENAKRSYQICVRGGTEIDRTVMEMIAKQWPEISEDQS